MYRIRLFNAIGWQYDSGFSERCESYSNTAVAKCSVSNSSYDMALYRYLLADMPQIIYPPLAHKV